MNWKKEAARRGYWYRKTKKVVLKLKLEVTSAKHELSLQLLWGQINSNRELTKLQKAKDIVWTKYINYIGKYNEAKEEADSLKLNIIASDNEIKVLKQDNDKLRQEIEIAKQDNDRLRQEIEAAKEKKEINVFEEENNDLKEEINDLKQEVEDLEYMLEPMMNRINRLAEENKQLTELFEEDPKDTYQVMNNTDTTIKTSPETQTNQPISKAKTEEFSNSLPKKPKRPKRKKQTKRTTEKKRKL